MQIIWDAHHRGHDWESKNLRLFHDAQKRVVSDRLSLANILSKQSHDLYRRRWFVFFQFLKSFQSCKSRYPINWVNFKLDFQFDCLMHKIEMEGVWALVAYWFKRLRGHRLQPQPLKYFLLGKIWLADDKKNHDLAIHVFSLFHLFALLFQSMAMCVKSLPPNNRDFTFSKCFSSSITLLNLITHQLRIFWHKFDTATRYIRNGIFNLIVVEHISPYHWKSVCLKFIMTYQQCYII